jgi:hypothetical protein
MLKKLKDMKDIVNAAPGMLAQGELAQGQLAQGQQAAHFGQFGGLPPARHPVSEMLANQTQPASAAASAAAGLASGIAARRTVMITGMRQIGMINFDLLVEFELTVMPDGLPPYPVTTQQTVSQLQIGQLRSGLLLPAAVDTSNPAAVWLDLTGIK